MENLLKWLQNWYLSQCDGDWEHEYGVKIDTLDNPGWTLSINLSGTECEEKTFTPVNLCKNPENWIQCSVNDQTFEAAARPTNLIKIIEIFREWVES